MRDGRDDGHGGLSAAGHHIDVGRVQIVFQVHHGHGVRANGGRRQVNHLDAVFLQQRIVAGMGSSTGGIEHNTNVLEVGQLQQPFNTFMGGGHAQPCRTGQAVRAGVDTDHGTHAQVFALAQYLDHQVGADIARANNGDGNFGVCHMCYSEQRGLSLR